MEYSAVIVAAGSGTRMKLGYNKVYAPLKDDKTILETTVSVFAEDPDCRQIVVVTDADMYYEKVGNFFEGKVVLAQGGNTRQESVYHGLCAAVCDTVMIHDGARPYVDEDCLKRLKNVLETDDAALLMVPVKDTIKVVKDGIALETPDRSTLYAAQTPQAFRTDLILSCMRQAFKEGFIGTDDASLVEKYGNVPVRVVEGSYANIKITTPEDLK